MSAIGPKADVQRAPIDVCFRGHKRRSNFTASFPLVTDSVEKVRRQSSWSERAHEERVGGTCRLRSGWLDVRHRDQFRQLPEVLGGGCQEEFIAGTIRSS